MRARFIDLELSKPLEPIWGMEGYEGANVLVRFHGKPIGWAYAVGSNHSFISPDRISQAIDHHISWQCVEAVLGRGRNSVDQAGTTLPPISVIVCRGPGGRRSDDCVAALRRQAYEHFEILLVDYGPDSMSCFPYSPNVRRLHAGDSNLAVARNQGVAEARYDIVAFLDQDSYPDRQWLQTVGRAFSSGYINAVCGLVAPAELNTMSQHRWQDSEYGGGRSLERRIIRKARLSERDLLRADLGSGGNMAFHRSVLEELGGFDARYSVDAVSGGSEAELFHRLLAQGYALLYEPTALTWRRPPRDSESVRKIAYERGTSVGFYMFMCYRKGTVGFRALMCFGFHDWAWRRIAKPLLKPRTASRSLVIAELVGAVVSPLRFWRARKRFGKLAAEANTKSLRYQQPVNKRLPEPRETGAVVPEPDTAGGTVLGRVKVVRTWYPHWGAYSGINQYLKHINTRLYRTTTLLVHENDGQFPFRAPRLREWLRYWCRKDDMAWYNLSDLRAEFSILQACCAERPDVVHYLDGEHAAQWIPRLSALPARLRPAFVVSYHQPPDVMEYAIRKDTIDYFDHVVAIAPEQLEFLHRFASSVKVSLILHGVDTEFFRPLSGTMPADTIRCLSVGHNYRDYSIIRQVAVNLRQENRIEFHIVSPHPTGLEGLPNVVLHRDIDDLALLRLYQDADILFLPLVKATANNALLEGIACGLPVVTTNLPSVKAYLPGPEAMLIDTKDPSDYTDAVLSLSQDFQQRQLMGTQARQRAEELSWPKIAAQYEAIYSQLISRRH
jgi:glycosyltransferase involved in cell wall biosynthesis/GT2 family glycosyltransferase